MSLHGFLLLLCLSASAGAKSDRYTESLVLVENGENVTMQCSTTLEGQDGMYLYRGADMAEEVLYYHSSDKVTAKGRYRNRVQTEGTFNKTFITISNLTRNDTGIYICAYQTFRANKCKALNVPCSVYILIGKDEVLMHCPNGSTPSLLFIIIISTCTVTTLIIIFITLIVRGVKRCIGVRSSVHRPGAPNDHEVYEEMSKNSLCSPAATVQSSSNP